ncbi:hypothetical protein M2246_003628 [Bacillus sp. LEw-kw-24]|nr:hypothetical protein [Bacillus sp. LEw-kw-24]MDH6558277.1 hypothetical protein [Bacillus sp. LEw-kw-2]MDH8704143.1 hypothetical protein [Stenotrophomonas sp. 1198]MDP9745478.1 hypothetical protein [Bacillus thuringiensis]
MSDLILEQHPDRSQLSGCYNQEIIWSYTPCSLPAP